MFEVVPRLPANHLRGASMQDGARLWVTSAFCGEVSLASTVGGVHATLLMSPAVARAVAQELLACAEAIDP